MIDRVLVVPVPKYGEGAHIIYSAAKRNSDETFGEFRVKNNFSFCYINGEYAAEWEPENGPIQVWHKCNQVDARAMPHYVFDFTDSPPLNWSQLAVEKKRIIRYPTSKANLLNIYHLILNHHILQGKKRTSHPLYLYTP